jgi:hypothetical protein
MSWDALIAEIEAAKVPGALAWMARALASPWLGLPAPKFTAQSLRWEGKEERRSWAVELRLDEWGYAIDDEGWSIVGCGPKVHETVLAHGLRFSVAQEIVVTLVSLWSRGLR